MSPWTRRGDTQNAIYEICQKYQVQVRQEGSFIHELADLIENLAERLITEHQGSEGSEPAPTDGPDYHADRLFHDESRRSE